MRTGFLLAPASLLMLLGLTLAAHAAPGELIVRGRVTQADGTPVAGARISLQGTQREIIAADDAGQYLLTLELGSPADMARRPVAVRMRAEQRGWRFELPGGDAELGVELRLVAGDNGVARCEVRSNQPRVGTAIAQTLTADQWTTVVAIVNFIGTRGEATGSPPPLDLPVVDRVALPGVPAPTAPAPETAREQKPAGGTQAGAIEAKPSKKKKDEAVEAKKADAKPPRKGNAATDVADAKPSAEKSKPLLSDPPAATVPVTPPAVAARPPDARELAEARRRELAYARDAEKRSRDEAQTRDRLQRRSLAEEKARTVNEQRALGSAEDELLKARDAEEKRWSALRHDVLMIAGSTDTMSAPPVGALDGLAGAPTHPEHRARQITTPQLTAARDTVRVRPPQPMPEPPVAPARAQEHPSAPAPARMSAPVPVRTSVPAPAPAPARMSAPVPARTSVPAPARASAPDPTPAPARTEQRDQTIPAPRPTTPRDTVRVRPPPIPRPDSGPRARARPLVIRTNEARPGTPGTPSATGDSCSCLIEGTVEVDSDRPLPVRTRVAVSLGWFPAIADTVELFMGSPRAFTLPPAPCGPQRLRIVSLGAARYDVVSRDAMAGFRCEAGVLHQFRVVLRPR